MVEKQTDVPGNILSAQIEHWCYDFALFSIPFAYLFQQNSIVIKGDIIMKLTLAFKTVLLF